MVAERPLRAHLAGLDAAFEHHLRVGRHLEVDGLALDELDSLAAQEAGEHELVDVLRKGRARRVGGDRVAAQRDRDGDGALRGEPVGPAVLVHLPVHVRGARVDLLHPIHADVADARARVLREDRGEGDEGRRVAGPAVLDGQRVEVGLEHDLLADAARDRLRERVGEALQLPEALHLLHEPLRRLHLDDRLELARDRVEAGLAEGEAHAPLRAELVDEKRVRGALDVQEEERRPAPLDDAVGDLRDLEVRVDLGLDLDELPLPLEQVDPGAQIGDRHRFESIRPVGARAPAR